MRIFIPVKLSCENWWSWCSVVRDCKRLLVWSPDSHHRERAIWSSLSVVCWHLPHRRDAFGIRPRSLHLSQALFHSLVLMLVLFLFFLLLRLLLKILNLLRHRGLNVLLGLRQHPVVHHEWVWGHRHLHHAHGVDREVWLLHHGGALGSCCGLGESVWIVHCWKSSGWWCNRTTSSGRSLLSKSLSKVLRSFTTFSL